METVAAVLGTFILVCLFLIAAALVVLSWVFTWDEAGRILRHRRAIRSMDRRLEEIVAGDPSSLDR